MKKSDVTRRIVESTLEKALAELSDDPARGIRKLADLGQLFSKGRFQKQLFETAQAMLENEDSAYYRLLEHIVADVDHATLVRFGVNLGYNGCTNGARLLRENAARLGCHIPWLLAFRLEAGADCVSDARVGDAITAARALGVYTYLLSCGSGMLPQALALADAAPDCAFFLLLDAAAVNESSAAALAARHNLLVSIQADGTQAAAMARLRKKGCFTALHSDYQEAMANDIISGRWLAALEPAGAAFVFLIPRHVNAATRRRVHAYARSTRNAQQHPFFLIEAAVDIAQIDTIITGRGAAVCFLADGRPANADGPLPVAATHSLRGTPLRELLPHLGIAQG